MRLDRRREARVNILLRKLEGFEDLGASDRAVLDRVTAKFRQVDAHRDLVEEGDAPDDVHLILEGFAYRYKLLKNGRRQIFAFLVPGDFCDLHVFILREMDHNIATLSPCKVVDIPRRVVLDLTENHPRIARALMWTSLVDEAVLREWLVNVGQRPAAERIAHLFCEILVRLEAVGQTTDGGEYVLPITQIELADTMGLSGVHVNRVLRELREAGLVRVTGHAICIPDVKALKRFSGFTDRYLHYQRVQR